MIQSYNMGAIMLVRLCAFIQTILPIFTLIVFIPFIIHLAKNDGKPNKKLRNIYIIIASIAIIIYIACKIIIFIM